MAITINWYRGSTAALAEAVRTLDERLAAVESLTTTGALPVRATVAGEGAVSAVHLAPATATVVGAGVVTARATVVATASVAGVGAVSGVGA